MERYTTAGTDDPESRAFIASPSAAGGTLLGAAAGRPPRRPSSEELTEALGGAIARTELSLEFQPARRITGALGQAGTIHSVEALLRWRHPTRGVIPTVDTLAAARSSGLIYEIGSWVLRQAARQARDWQAMAPPYRKMGIAVNVSVEELARTELIDEVAEVVQNGGLDPGSLSLEVDAASLARGPRRLVESLRALRAVGAKVTLDDCGVSATAMKRLDGLPIDAVKLVPSAVAALGTAEADEAGIRQLLQQARRLGMETIAEGVETSQQLAGLRTLGCEIAQGYLFGKPLGAPGITSLLRAERRRESGASA